MNYVLLILGMAVITFAIRCAAFAFGERLTLCPPCAQRLTSCR